MFNYDLAIPRIETALKNHLALDIKWVGINNPIAHNYYKHIRSVLELLELEKHSGGDKAIRELRFIIHEYGTECEIEDFNIHDFEDYFEDMMTENIRSTVAAYADFDTNYKRDKARYLAALALSVSIWASIRTTDELRILPGALLEIAEALGN